MAFDHFGECPVIAQRGLLDSLYLTGRLSGRPRDSALALGQIAQEFAHKPVHL